MQMFGKYEVLGKLSSGAMGTIFKARDTILDRQVALKVMAPHLIQDEEYRLRFRREAQAAGRLHHPNIVTIYEQGEAEGYSYIAMELLEGRNLEEILQQKVPVPLGKKLEWVIQICHALGHAHSQGLVHRDVKPANIRVLPDETIKIVDFGIVRTSDSKLTGVGEFFGSPSYMSPEQLRSSKDVDGRSDLFSIGIILYELLTGQLPFRGDNIAALYMEIINRPHPPLQSLWPEAPVELAEIVDLSLAKTVDDRFQSCEEMARRIGNVLQRLQTARPSPAWQETRQVAGTDDNATASFSRKEIQPVPQPSPEPPPRVVMQVPVPVRPNRSGSGKKILWTAAGISVLAGMFGLWWMTTSRSTQLTSLQPSTTILPSPSTTDFPMSSTTEFPSPSTTEYPLLPTTTRLQPPPSNAWPSTTHRSATETQPVLPANGKRMPDTNQVTVTFPVRPVVTTTLTSVSTPLVEAITETTTPVSPPTTAIKRDTAVKDPGGRPVARGQWRDPATGMDFVWIPPGTFAMGCSIDDGECESNESPRHTVRISNGFWLGKYEVTQAQWRSITGNNPSTLQGDLLPVEQVSWNEVQAFLGRLNAAGGGKYRLPTEAEWEYAARSGSHSSRYGDVNAISWYSGNSQGKMQPVGQKAANAWGLHDMLGNVWEWCQDRYDRNFYKQSPAVDPTGPASGKECVIRGGSFANSGGNARCSYRLKFSASQRGSIGFRVLRMPS